MRLTSSHVRDLTKYLAKKHKVKIVDKATAKEMKIVGQALHLMGIFDRDYFLSNFATTIPQLKMFGITKTRIYLPFEPGERGKGVPDLKRQVEVICHEFHHARQMRKDPSYFAVRYLTSKAKRAWYEARAMHTELEMIWFLRGRLPSLGQMAQGLEYYKVRRGDIRTVEKHLKIVSGVVCAGKLHNRISKNSIAWLKRHAA